MRMRGYGSTPNLVKDTTTTSSSVDGRKIQSDSQRDNHLPPLLQQ